MTKKEADVLLLERFEQLNDKAEMASDSGELVALCEGATKLYITMLSSGVFDGTTSKENGGMLN